MAELSAELCEQVAGGQDSTLLLVRIWRHWVMGDKRKGSAENSIVQQPVAQLPTDYSALLRSIKERIQTAQIKAVLAVNPELILLYWEIGRDILDRQDAEGWGAKVIDRLALDLHDAFPEMEGLSPRNLKYMRSFARAYPDRDMVQRTLAQIPWGHNLSLLEKIKAPAVRLWYARQTVANGWSRAMLTHWIESDLHARQGKAITNFEAALPAPQSDLAVEIVRDPLKQELADA